MRRLIYCLIPLAGCKAATTLDATPSATGTGTVLDSAAGAVTETVSAIDPTWGLIVGGGIASGLAAWRLKKATS